jgi:hypothetical protein
MDKTKRTFIPLVLIILASVIFLSATYIENIDRFARVFIIVVCNTMYASALIMIVRSACKKAE